VLATYLSVQQIDCYVQDGRDAHPQDIGNHQVRSPLTHFVELVDGGRD